MTFELLKQLDETFTLKKLYEQGIICKKVSMSYRIFVMVKCDMETNKSKKSVAVQHVADQLRIPVLEVYRALKNITPETTSKI